MRSYWLARTANGLRKVAAGLRPCSESVWPGVRNDLFVAHESIYAFFERWCVGARVVDAGCGTGYGSYRLAKSGAKEVLGVDIDESNIRFAQRKYHATNLRFEVADIQQLDARIPQADVVVGSNSVEHLHHPEQFLSSSRRILSRGPMILALPPIFTTADRLVHNEIHYHRANLSVSQWLGLFADQGWSVRCFAHRLRSSELPIDFRSPFRSKLDTSDFLFEETSVEDLYRKGAITAVVLRSN